MWRRQLLLVYLDKKWIISYPLNISRLLSSLLTSVMDIYVMALHYYVILVNWRCLRGIVILLIGYICMYIYTLIFSGEKGSSFLFSGCYVSILLANLWTLCLLWSLDNPRSPFGIRINFQLEVFFSFQYLSNTCKVWTSISNDCIEQMRGSRGRTTM